MASRPHDGPDPDETRPESGDPARAGGPDPSGGAELGDREVEARWAEMLTQLDQPAGPERPTGPAGPDDDAPPPDDAGTADVVVLDPGERGDPIDADPRGWVEVEVDEHFEPPDPGPVFGGDPLLTMAWIAVVGPLVLLLLAVLAWRDIPSIALQVAAVCFLIGVGVLVWRLPASRDEDDGPGAVV
jgi:hypothetical protein